MGKEFIKILKECFPKGNSLHQIFNCNTVKLSYSCLPNISRIISKHNSRVLTERITDPPACLCDEGTCPVEGKCESAGVVYQATVNYQGKVDTYVGLTERKFITRHTEHYRNFNNRNPKNSTSLSRKIWNIEDNNQNFELKWKILQNCRPYQPGSSECKLCLTEIYFIIFSQKTQLLKTKVK